jgi:hypothetical protein
VIEAGPPEESAPVEAPPPASLFTDYARRAVTGALGTLQVAQSTALQRYAAWILTLEGVTTRSLASVEKFLLGALKANS